MESTDQSISRGRAQRETLFDLFSRNLASVKRHPRLRVSPEFDEGVICPMCFKLFTREGLSDEYDDALTLEDVPPAALGGRPALLTCKLCNNSAGASLDSHLIRKLQMDEFLSGIPEVEIETRFRPGAGIRLPATTSFTPEGTLYIRYRPESSNPDQLQLLAEMEQSQRIEAINLDFLPGHKINQPEIALIRIAYLLAFVRFGYGFLVSSSIHAVRHQVQSPTERILPDWGIMPGTFPDETLGITILARPKELQGFLAVFDLRTPKRTTRHGILLPGPTSPALSIYSTLASMRQNTAQRSITYSVNGIPEGDYVGDPSLAFASHHFWKTFR